MFVCWLVGWLAGWLVGLLVVMVDVPELEATAANSTVVTIRCVLVTVGSLLLVRRAGGLRVESGAGGSVWHDSWV